ncbi:hypothetical protein [Mammaliicoccus sciuri]|uniref:hypothetical protein n=1 Tax=Mammaliicoccus sciuri TaxID=1296 RepID=UPI001E4554BA|nr:hypothetical protein [Mammaliicoccus sciuri]MCD8898669.1 hypothetical protein [Mammaliicoccus sciuri]MCD8913926.1 hypothetical protein [Mammaliicoccus sciuri]
MKKQILATLTGAMLLVPFTSNYSLNTTQKEISTNQADAKVIASHTYSKKQTKAIAKQSKKGVSNAKEWGTVMSGVFGRYGVPVAAGVLASANGQKNLINTFNKAAKQNKRVKMTISTGPTPNLNKVSYKIVK